MTGFKPGDRVRPAAHCRDTWPASAGIVIGPVPTPVRVVWDNATMITVHPPTNLETLGEPMSKRTDFLDADGSPMTIEGRADHENWAIKFASTYREFTPADAPGVALAILEAAGVEPIPFDEAPETEAGHAAWVLRHHVQASEEAASKAADRAKLESEAWELWLAYQPATGCGKFSSLHEGNQAKFLTLARRARELHGVTA